jgi:hypothetical protein
MIASEILMCGVRTGVTPSPAQGEAAENLVESLRRRHAALDDLVPNAGYHGPMLSRFERRMQDTVEHEIQTILTNLGRPDLSGHQLDHEMRQLWAIQDQGWSPNLFEGLLTNSSHWLNLKHAPQNYGRVLGDYERVDSRRGIHLILDCDRTRILELPLLSFSILLSHQSLGVPQAKAKVSFDLWFLAINSSIWCDNSNRLAVPPPSLPKRSVKVFFPHQPSGAEVPAQQAARDAPKVGSDAWRELTESRTKLIDKKYASGLSVEEDTELERLQRLSLEALDRDLPISTLNPADLDLVTRVLKVEEDGQQ